MTVYKQEFKEVLTSGSKTFTFNYPNYINVNGGVDDRNITTVTSSTSFTPSWNKSGSSVKPSITVTYSALGNNKGVCEDFVFYTVNADGVIIDVIVMTVIVHNNMTDSKITQIRNNLVLQQTDGGYLFSGILLSETTPQPFANISVVESKPYGLNGFVVNGTVDTSTIGKRDIENVILVEKKTISYRFTAPYTLSVSTDYGSSVSPHPTRVGYGSNVTLTISKREGYRLTSVTVNDVAQNIPSQGIPAGDVMTVNLTNITSNQSVVVRSTSYTYTITTSAGENGTITNTSTVSYGGNISINITPNTGYEVEKVIVDGVNKGKISVYVFNNVKENHTISATFKQLEGQKYTITCVTTSNGNISVTPSSATKDTVINISVNPSEGYRLKQIDSSPTIAINNNQFTMPAQNVTLTPVFEKIETQTYAITVGTSEHGTATASHTSASAGTTITMTATPGQGYVLKSYATQPYVSVVNGQFVMPSSPITVTPIFDVASIVKTSYDVYVSTETTDKGDVSITGVDETKGIISIRAEAEPGYRFSEWEISNGVCFLSSPYTSETLMIIQDSDVSVVAHFVKDILPTKVNQVHLTITR